MPYAAFDECGQTARRNDPGIALNVKAWQLARVPSAANGSLSTEEGRSTTMRGPHHSIWSHTSETRLSVLWYAGTM